MKNQETALEPLQAPQDMNNINNEFFERMEKLDENQLTKTEAEYLEFAEGEIHNLIFTGFENATFGEDVRESVTFLGKDGWKFINSNSVIVNAMKRLQAPAPVRIMCVGEKKNAKGNKYKDFKIFTL